MSEMQTMEFQFGGRLSLDLTWTLRYRAVYPTELLQRPSDLRRWLDAVGLHKPATVTSDDLAHVVSLRETIYRMANAKIDGHSFPRVDRSLLNQCAALPTPSPQINSVGSKHTTVSMGTELSSALSLIARDAIDLLSVDDGRLRRCTGPRCSLLFHDSSRPGARRWCTTARCGNKVNTRAYRDRQRDES
jgi:predicted RNA-binding Zn ribbon-like protein